MNVQGRRSAREQYLAALWDVERGHRRRPWPSVLVLVSLWMVCVGVVLGWLWLVFWTAEFVGAAVARLWLHGGGL